MSLRRARILTRVAVWLGLSAMVACFLGGRPPTPRFFRPDVPPSAGVLILNPEIPLRLLRVTGASHLRERIVWRTEAGEYGFYDARRWTELPAHYVEQYLARELFEVRGIPRASAGRVPTLNVEVLAFEEILEPAHEAQVELRVLLADATRVSLLERRFHARRAIDGREARDMTKALGRALHDVLMQAADAVQAELERQAVSDREAG